MQQLPVVWRFVFALVAFALAVLGAVAYLALSPADVEGLPMVCGSSKWPALSRVVRDASEATVK